VAVCPAGIDIREGFQLECTTCARCVDACEGVMGKLGHPSLIRYRPLEEKTNSRTRTIAYGSLLGVLAVAITALFLTRQGLSATVVRLPGSLYAIDDDGMVRDTFMLRVTNHADEAMDAHVEVHGLPEEAEIHIPAVHVEGAADQTVLVVVRVPHVTNGARATPFNFAVSGEGSEVEIPATFESGD
jgi:polyferredoxin